MISIAFKIKSRILKQAYEIFITKPLFECAICLIALDLCSLDSSYWTACLQGSLFMPLLLDKAI
jgi:hypothetical protein